MPGPTAKQPLLRARALGELLPGPGLGRLVPWVDRIQAANHRMWSETNSIAPAKRLLVSAIRSSGCWRRCRRA
jgi:hypothetical protein